MLKLSIAAYLGAGLLLLLIVATGNLAWDNRWLWGPACLLGVASFLGFGGWDHEEHRGPLLLMGALSFGSLMAYVLFYLVVFAYSGY